MSHQQNPNKSDKTLDEMQDSFDPDAEPKSVLDEVPPESGEEKPEEPTKESDTKTNYKKWSKIVTVSFGVVVLTNIILTIVRR